MSDNNNSIIVQIIANILLTCTLGSSIFDRHDDVARFGRERWFGSISIICSDRFPFVPIDFHLFGSISNCLVRFPFVRFNFQIVVRSDFHFYHSTFDSF